MPHPKDRKPRTRQRILRAAMQLFARRGYEATRIEDVMQACGMTRGGFYAHFACKEALYREAVEGLAAAPKDAVPADPWGALLEPLAAAGAPAAAWSLLAADLAHPQAEVRRGYARVLQAAQQHLRSALRAPAEDSASVLAATATVVGVIGIAATLDDPVLRAQWLQAGAQAVQQLAGGQPAVPESASHDEPDQVPVHPAFFWAPEEPRGRAH